MIIDGQADLNQRSKAMEYMLGGSSQELVSR